MHFTFSLVLMEQYVAGAIAAVLASFCWSIAAVLYRRAVSGLNDPLATSGLRVPLALAFMATLSLFLEKGGSLAFLLVSWEALFWVLLATTIAIIIGDTLYMVALRNAGVSIGYPVGYVYPVYATLFAVLLLGETLTVGLVAGLALSLTGIWLSSFKPPSRLGDRRRVFIGVMAAVLAGLSWGLGSVVFKVAVINVDPLIVNVIKLIYLLLIMSPFIVRLKVKLIKEYLAYALLGGLFGLGIGDWLLYVSLAAIGAARAATLTTSSPLISILLAFLFLKEEVSWKQAAGACLIITGVLLAASL